MINKIILIAILNLIALTYGNQSVDLSIRNSQTNALNPSFKSFIEEDIYGFILKENYDDENKCKAKLEEYCKELKDIDPELNKVNSNVKEICNNNNKEQKCKDLKLNIKENLDKISNELYVILQKSLTYEDFDKYLPRCLFLHNLTKNILEYCYLLKYNYYIRKHLKLTLELILHAVGNSIANYDDFKEKMKEICPILIQQGTNFISECFKIKESFEELNKYINYFCNSLNINLNDNELQEQCHKKLKSCYFLKNKCKKKCNELKVLCEKKNITYKPPGKDFNPIEPETTLLKIELEDFYKKMKDEGIYIGNVEATLDNILIYLSSTTTGFSGNKCRIVLSGNCDFFKFLSPEFKELCQNSRRQKCRDISKITNKCRKFKIMLYLAGFSTHFQDHIIGQDILWDKLSTSFSDKELLKFDTNCFYIQRSCRNNLLEVCKNVKIANNKKQQRQLFIKLIEGKLVEEQYNLKSKDDKLKICQKVVMEKCVTLVNSNIENFLKCLRPKEICLELEEIIFTRSKDLEQALDQARDFPKEEDCVELKKGCESIAGDLGSNNAKCVTLKERCKYLKVTKELKYVFLKDKSDSLANIQNCMKALKEKCDRLFKRGTNTFDISCALPEETCKFMVSEVKNHCSTFKNNIEKHDIVNKSKNGNETLVEEICILWDPYCDELMENCPDKLKKGDNGNEKGVCLQLKENCRPFFEKLKLENELMHELKGSLGDKTKCKKTLGKHCTEKKNQANQKFNSFCNTDKNKNVEEKVCKKLVEKIKRKCPTLENELNEEKDELKKKKDEYEKVKQESEKFAKEAKLLLSIPEQDGQGGGSKVQDGNAPKSVGPPVQPPAPAQPTPGGAPAAPAAPGGSTPSGTTNTSNVILVRRTFVSGEVSEPEKKAFVATARTLELYLELKEKCKGLKGDCGFRKDCPGCEAACTEIDKLCEGIKGLKVTPHHTVTLMTIQITTTTMITTTTTTTITTTTTATKSIHGGKVTEQCAFSQTTEIWLLRTCLHTSTLTSTSTVTSTVTLTSMRKCKPTRCTSDSSKETETQKEEEKEEKAKQNEGMKMRVPEIVKIILLGVMVIGML
ncbi:hypothetical protein PNEG_00563 [Pneumocystis murina B123]|uniref:Major surface glycoprotein 2 C-terminal domain-containing protein n=1 Tax=Pneumocystis murina (strain B123) TaxID=1069680 RepID=M7PCC1_PNEMU|nr:hypothetical protein PNEG_00563 [Pneumocystis murina B123]EMR11555.2 hypothetical protein PNEG_00563 [Pneumocystis murina B123]